MNKKRTVLAALLVTSVFITKAQSQQEAPQSKVRQEKPKHSSDLTNFLKRNPAVANVSWTGGNKIVIMLKNDKVETYNLADLQQKQVFETKYGTAPTAPPPPPPPPPSIKKQPK